MIARLFCILDAPQAGLAFVRVHRTGVLLATALVAGSLGVLRTTAPAGAATVTVKLPSADSPAPPSAAMLEAEGRAILMNAAMPFAFVTLRAAAPFVISGTPENKQLAQRCLTQAVYYEAGYEPLAGRRAVAQVVLNRVRSSAFPNSVCGVIYQGAGTSTCQFTFVCTADLDRPPATAAWHEAELVARAALSGYVEQSVGEATHYHANYVAPRWAPTLAKVAAIGMHIFYESPGLAGRPAAFTQGYGGEPRDAATLRLAGLAPAVTAEPAAQAGSGLASGAATLAYHIDALLDPAPMRAATDGKAVSAALVD